jgi:ankyrin repeat protein
MAWEPDRGKPCWVAHIASQPGFDMSPEELRHVGPPSAATACAQLLLNRGADARARDSMGRDALWYAMEHENADLALYLITRVGVGPNLASASGEALQAHNRAETATPLIRALLAGAPMTVVVSALLAAGADPNDTGRTGIPPLIHAVRAKTGALGLCMSLLSAPGTNVHAVDFRGRNALAEALVTPGQGDIAVLLAESGADMGRMCSLGTGVRASEDLHDEVGPPIVIAVHWGAPAHVVNALLSAGADINGCSAARHLTALMLAAMTVVLGTPKAEVRAASGDEREPGMLYDSVHALPQNCNMSPEEMRFGRDCDPIDSGQSIARILIAEGAAVQQRDADGRDALAYAIDQGKSSFAAMLVEAGADPNLLCTSSKKGPTGDPAPPLVRAARAGLSVGALRALLRAGSDVNGRSESGITPLMACARTGTGRVDLARVLEPETGGEIVQHVAAAHGQSPEEARCTWWMGLSGLGGREDHPAEAEVRVEHPVAEALLEAGADGTLADGDGHDALWWAISRADDGLALLLLRHGAHRSVRGGIVASDTRPEPILVTAIKCRAAGIVVGALLDAGADPNECGPSGGESALDLAVRTGDRAAEDRLRGRTG